MLPQGEFVFRKLKPQRPTVIRTGDIVRTCFYYKGTKTCLGPVCYWIKVGECPIFKRIKNKRVSFTAK
jgi:hypothetical protein